MSEVISFLVEKSVLKNLLAFWYESDWHLSSQENANPEKKTMNLSEILY